MFYKELAADSIENEKGLLQDKIKKSVAYSS